MAAGMPVICSNIRGNVDLIDENGGFLVDCLDVKCMSKSISALYSDRCTANEMGKYNKKCSEKFDLFCVMPEVEKIINYFIGL